MMSESNILKYDPRYYHVETNNGIAVLMLNENIVCCPPTTAIGYNIEGGIPVPVMNVRKR
ncbi:MAG: hypothetical protein ABWZ79_05925 [Pedobacter agri]